MFWTAHCGYGDVSKQALQERVLLVEIYSRTDFSAQFAVTRVRSPPKFGNCREQTKGTWAKLGHCFFERAVI